MSEQVRDGRSTRWDPHRRERRAAITAAAVTAIEHTARNHQRRPERYLGWIEQHPNLYRFLAKHAFTIDGTGLPMRDDAKAILAIELTSVLAGYMRAMGLDDAAAERTITGVVGLIDNTALWWLSVPETPRAELTAWLTKQVWLLIDSAVRDQGLDMDPDDMLPTPQPAG